MRIPRRELARRATLAESELAEVWRCRRAHNQLGFAYQLVFVRFYSRFPTQIPFEVVGELVLFAAVQLGLDPQLIEEYQAWQSTLSRHQQRIVDLLGLRRFDDDARHELEVFVFEAATRLEQNATLRKRAEEFLAEQRILRPADSTIIRIVGEQRQRARDHIFGRVAEAIPADVVRKLEQLLVVAEGETVSPLQAIKANPDQPSVASMHVALRKLKSIEDTGVLALDLSWLSSNYQRALFHKVRKSSAHRLRDVKEPVRHAALACFLWQSYGDAVD